jgi:hypothetical protein
MSTDEKGVVGDGDGVELEEMKEFGKSHNSL